MSATVMLGIFAIFWFLAFFCLLPLNLSGEVNEHGAPANPRLRFKALLATTIATILWAIVFVMVLNGAIAL